MKRADKWTVSARRNAAAALAAVMGMLTAGGLTGCVAVGYRSGGGWFVWPGSLGLLVLLLVLFLVLRGRR